MPDKPLSPLFLRCAACGRVFPTGISVDRSTFQETSLPPRSHECPFCGYFTAYNKGDYLLDAGEAGPRRP